MSSLFKNMACKFSLLILFSTLISAVFAQEVSPASDLHLRIVRDNSVSETPELGFKDMNNNILYGGVIGGTKNYFTHTKSKAQVLRDCNAVQLVCFPAWGRWDESARYVYHLDEFSERVREMKMQNMKVTAPMLMGWDKYYPEWFRKGDFPADTLNVIMKNWLKAIITYKGNDTLVDNWNVVNEAITWDGKGSYWPLFNSNYESACEFQRMGFEPDSSGLTGIQNVNSKHPVYIRKAFEYARTLTDNKLELRDAGFEFPGDSKYHSFYQLAKHLKEVGAPVDVIGFQTHLDLQKTYDWDAYSNNIKRYIDLGYEVIIPELDIGDVEKSWTEEKAMLQKEMYYNLVCAAIKGGASEFHTWGFNDMNEKYWRFGERAYPYDYMFEKKPAWYGIKEALVDMSSILFWEMEENIMDTMPDVMACNNIGLMKNFNHPEFVKGYKSKALQFDGVDDIISTEELSTVIDSDFSFSCFIKSSTNKPSVIAELTNNAGNNFQIGINADGKIYVNGFDNENSQLEANVSITNGIWHFLAFQRESDVYRIYVDGYENNASKKGQILTFIKLTVGAKNDGTSPFNGVIDEVKLYDSAIEEASFQRNYLIKDQLTLDYKNSQMSVKLTWKDNGDEEIGFVIDRKIGDGDWKIVGEVDASVDYYIETVDIYDTIYTYRVRSASRFANGGTSNEVQIQTPNDPNTSTKEREVDQGFDIFPNPVNDSFTFRTTEKVSIQVYDLHGKLVLINTNVSGGEKIDFSEFKSGVYVLKAESKEKVTNVKIVKN